MSRIVYLRKINVTTIEGPREIQVYQLLQLLWERHVDKWWSVLLSCALFVGILTTTTKQRLLMKHNRARSMP